MQAINLGARFLLELAMLASFGYWGFQATREPVSRIVLGIGVPVMT